MVLLFWQMGKPTLEPVASICSSSDYVYDGNNDDDDYDDAHC